MRRSPSGGPVVQWIERPVEIDSLANQISKSDRLALDTEANGFHAYLPRLCLIQVAWERLDREVEVALIDPLALRGDLGQFAVLLADERLEKIMHGADYDLRLLKRDAGVELRGLFDTQAAAKLVGRSRTGLAALAEEISGVRLNKSAQRTDWRKRPLGDRELSYAADDVKVLFPIRDAMKAELAALGRDSWIDEECRELERVEAAPKSAIDVLAQLGRIPGAGRLDPRGRAVLLSLLEWRDGEAQRRDRPPGFIVSNDRLLELSKGRPKMASELASSGVPRSIASRYGSALLGAVKRGEESRPVPKTEKPMGSGRRLDPVSAARMAKLKSRRELLASRLALEPGLVCPAAVLRAVARLEAADEVALRDAGLRPWQIEVFGREALRCLDGVDEGVNPET